MKNPHAFAAYNVVAGLSAFWVWLLVSIRRLGGIILYEPNPAILLAEILAMLALTIWAGFMVWVEVRR